MRCSFSRCRFFPFQLRYPLTCLPLNFSFPSSEESDNQLSKTSDEYESQRGIFATSRRLLRAMQVQDVVDRFVRLPSAPFQSAFPHSWGCLLMRPPVPSQAACACDSFLSSLLLLGVPLRPSSSLHQLLVSLFCLLIPVSGTSHFESDTGYWRWSCCLES